MLLKPSSTVLVTPPASEPISLAEARRQCHVDSTDTDHDGDLTQYIAAARSHFDAEFGVLGRALVEQTWRALYDCWPGNGAFLVPYPPLQSISSITYLDEDGNSQTLASSVYQVLRAGSNRRALVRLAYGQSWPSLRYVPEAVTVNFVCGHGDASSPPSSPPEPDVPRDLKQAMLLLIGHWFENRESVVVGTSAMSMPDGVDRLTQKFRADWI